MEKRRYADAAAALDNERIEHNVLLDQYQKDIRQLEEKMGAARDKQRLLVQRQIHAVGKMRAQEEIRRMDSSEAVLKFEELENRIERMEAEADLVNFGKPDLEEELESLDFDEEVEAELQTLKSSLTKNDEETYQV